MLTTLLALLLLVGFVVLQRVLRRGEQARSLQPTAADVVHPLGVNPPFKRPTTIHRHSLPTQVLALAYKLGLASRCRGPSAESLTRTHTS